jgi:eukaryotic-like serine/threonine-protein kinase
MSDRASAALPEGSAAPDPFIGRVVGGRFKISALIARGGMGRVYRAEQSPLGRVCAVKVLNPSYAGEHDPEFHKRFFLEASIASKLTHPNTVTVFDYGRADDDFYYMAMEYLDGHTLHRAIRDAGHLPEERAVHIARQICRSLREAHAHGVIHRDLKPANIFLVEHGDEPDHVKVLDFGLVKNVADNGEDLTQTGMFMGSPKYMAPEQIRGDRVDARTDVYALGIILYEMLTGKVPFDRPTSVNILMAHVHEEPPPLRKTNPRITVSRALEETVAGCMAKDPERRLRSMGDVLEALKRVGGGVNATASIAIGVGADRNSVSPSSRSSPARARGGLSSPGLRAGDRPGGSAPGVPTIPTGGGSKGMLAMAMAGGVAVAGAIGYVAIRPSRSPSPEASMVAPAAAGGGPVARLSSAPSAPTPPVPAAPVETAQAPVTLRVHTEPDGASVKEDGVELCASTPCEISFRGPDADPDREHTLTLARQGYRVEMRSVKAGDVSVGVKLAPIPRAAPAAPPAPRAAPQPAPRATEVTAAPPPGYKTDIPY